MRICILGAGGLGSVIGGYLARTGVDVTLIARPAHVDAIRRNGLRITGRVGECSIRENLTAVTSADDAEGHFDYLILLVKTKDTERALESATGLRPRVDTMLSLQNDPLRADKLRRWIEPWKVIGAVTIEGGTLVEPGHADNHVTATTTAYFGELDGTESLRVQRLTEAFTRAGLKSAAVTNIVQVTWEKLTQIASASGWSVSTLPAIPALYFVDGIKIREGAEHYVQLTKELLSVYKALGYQPQNFFSPFSRLKEIDSLSFDEAVQSSIGVGTYMEANNMRSRTSMHDDLLRGRKTEAEEIFRPFIDKAAELGLSIPTVTAVHRVMAVLNHYLKD
ncbi:ketopantoate reductase family protein [Nevskia sp.]|uniref:ketopantoate reductase family protein n=1 Tax=Nevskia sp. TaxID=1929292 RepID=UPI0025CC03A7|nr:2-dehydropantoate 2-reductase [Nevskia sp.]